MFEKFLAFFRRKPAAPVKRVPGEPPKPAATTAPRPFQPRPVDKDAPPDFGATLMVRRPPLEKKPEETGSAAADNSKKS